MSVLDLFTGAWTWAQLAGDLATVLVPATVAFWAGYERGRNAEIAQRRDGPEELEVRA